MVMIRCSDCSLLFYHRLVAVTIHVVLTGSDRLEEHPKNGGKGAEVSGKEKSLRRRSRAEKQTDHREKKTKLETTPNPNPHS